jgi:ribulose kinase
MSLMLAVDLGTESVRVAAFDAAAVEVASARRTYPTTFPQPGWAEQNPEDWWTATLEALREVAGQIRGRRVLGLGIATTSSTVAVLDADAGPLRPALLWMDGRAHEEARITAGVDHPVMRYCGGEDAVEWLVPKAMWVARHEPDTYAAAAHVVEAVDYLTYRLTGRWVGSRMNAVCKWNYSARDGGFSPELFAAFGVPDLVDKLPADVLAVGEPAGEILPAVLAETGIEGTPIVAVGGIDAHMSLVSTGALASGEVSVVAGTSVAHVTQMDDPVFTPVIWGPYPDALLDGRWLVEGGQVSGGVVLRWAADLVGRGGDRTPGLIEEATAVPPGSNGLLVLDYFMGNRTPYRDARLRGAVLGLTLGSTAAEVYRAAVESVAYGTRNVLQSFSEAGVPVNRVVFSGGIQHNPLWLRTTADVLGRPIELVRSANLTLLAGAACAATVGGLYPSLVESAAAFSAASTIVEPDPAAKDVHDAGFARYREATAAVGPVSHALADQAAGR